MVILPMVREENVIFTHVIMMDNTVTFATVHFTLVEIVLQVVAGLKEKEYGIVKNVHGFTHQKV